MAFDAHALAMKLTEDQTAELLAVCIEFLPEDRMYATLRETLTDEQRAECAAAWGA